jgi:hypothetical protein
MTDQDSGATNQSGDSPNSLSTDLRNHTHRAKRTATQQFLRGLFIAVCAVPLIFGAFEYAIWHMPVDSYTFIARNTDGQVIAHETSNDTRVASALRERINNDINDPSELFANLFGPGCNEPIYTGPDASYFYDFRAGAWTIETVWSPIVHTDCGQAWVNCGGWTTLTQDDPIMPITFDAARHHGPHVRSAWTTEHPISIRLHQREPLAQVWEMMGWV